MTQQEREARVREIQKEMADEIIQAVAKMRSPKRLLTIFVPPTLSP